MLDTLFCCLNLQPGSTQSGSIAQASNGTRKYHTRRYYKTASCSHVDESLFGFDRPQQAASASNSASGTCLEHQAQQRNVHRKSGNNSAPPKQTVQVITKDLIRNVL